MIFSLLVQRLRFCKTKKSNITAAQCQEMLALRLWISFFLKLSFDFYPGFIKDILVNVFHNFQLLFCPYVCDETLFCSITSREMKPENERHFWCLGFNKLLNFWQLKQLGNEFTLFFTLFWILKKFEIISKSLNNKQKIFLKQTHG